MISFSIDVNFEESHHYKPKSKLQQRGGSERQEPESKHLDGVKKKKSSGNKKNGKSAEAFKPLRPLVSEGVDSKE